MDEKNRVIYFLGVGKEKGRDPYFVHLYRVGFDGTGSEAAHAGRRQSRRHAFAIAGATSSTATPSRTFRRSTVLRDADGKLMRHAREGRHFEAAGHRLEAAAADHGEGARRRDRPLRADVQADESGPDEEVSRSSTTSIPARRPAAWAAAISRRRAATARRWRSWASSWWRSTAWARRGARRNSTKPISATWATTRCPTRWPA